MKNINTLPLSILAFVISILAAGGTFAAQTTQGDKTSAQKPAPLTLEDYLQQVSAKHQGYKAANQTAKAARLYAEEATLITRPNLTGNASKSATGQANPFEDNPSKTRTDIYSLGVSQATPLGINGQLTFNQSNVEIPSLPAYSANWTQLDLSVSLIRNFGGREIRAQKELIEDRASANAYQQSHIAKSILLEAEAAYWRLALSRELLNVQRDSLNRAQRMYDWTARRVRLQLADKGEGLQTSTNLQARKLELRQAEDEERAAAQAFNSSRGITSNTVDESLVEINTALISKMGIPERNRLRDDVKAAELQAKAASANARAQKERNTPTLELFGSTPLNEPEEQTNRNLSSLLPQSMRPGTTIGIRLTAPLDVLTQNRVREGYAAEATASALSYERKVFEEQRDWVDLSSRFLQAKERHQLFVDLINTQKVKLDYERDRQQRGRSTLQQVLLFENDFEQAQLGRIRTLAEIMTLNAQMKLYGVSYESR